MSAQSVQHTTSSSQFFPSGTTPSPLFSLDPLQLQQALLKAGSLDNGAVVIDEQMLLSAVAMALGQTNTGGGNPQQPQQSQQQQMMMRTPGPSHLAASIDEAAAPVASATASSSRSILLLWATVSQLLWWTVLAISIVSLPILAYTVRRMFTRHRKSIYFHFLATMSVLNMLMLITILFNLLSEYSSEAMPLLETVKGNFTCKMTVFVTNMLSCYSNWLWVMMFAQRFAHVFFPFGRKRLFLRLLDNSPALIIGTGIISISTQLWTPFLMRQVSVPGADGVSFCGPDEDLVGPTVFKWIAAVESVWTYAIPFCITLCTDVAVLIVANESHRFTVLPTSISLSSARGRLAGAGSGPSSLQHFRTRHNTSVSAMLLKHWPKASTSTFPGLSVDDHFPVSASFGAECAIGAKRQRSASNDSTVIIGTGGIERTAQNSDRSAPGRIGTGTEMMLIGGGPPELNGRCFSNNVIVSVKKRRGKMSNTALNGVTGKISSPLSTDNASQPLLKIQTEARLRKSNARLQLAIRRCLLLATMQLCLNLPNYILQLVDEFSDLRQTSERYVQFYLWADALFYLLYLSQYPMLALYVNWFHPNISSSGSTGIGPTAASVISTGGGGTDGAGGRQRGKQSSTDSTTIVPPALQLIRNGNNNCSGRSEGGTPTPSSLLNDISSGLPSRNGTITSMKCPLTAPVLASSEIGTKNSQPFNFDQTLLHPTTMGEKRSTLSSVFLTTTGESNNNASMGDNSIDVQPKISVMPTIEKSSSSAAVVEGILMGPSNLITGTVNKKRNNKNSTSKKFPPEFLVVVKRQQTPTLLSPLI